jgi:phospho-N-acetylmuramoyl-pentapeptide-transferase
MAEITPEIINNVATVFLLGLVGFSLSMLLTPIYTYFAYKYKWWKQNRTEDILGNKTPIFTKLHAAKIARHIPTMAGIVYMFSVAIITVLFNFSMTETWLPLAALAGGAAVGLIDDIINYRGLGGGVKGLRAPIKFAMITLVGLAGAWFFYFNLGFDTIHLPFPPYDLHLGWWIIPLFTFVVVATGNAVNITDGLDGLAGGLSVMAFGFFGIIAFLQGNMGVAGFCFTMVGAMLAYTWFNVFPARFFMTDVGSFALGASLGVVAMLTNTLFLLPIIAFVFAGDTATSLIQILSKKFFKRKIFLSAPVHHHLEAIGWPESKVTMRFWILGFISGIVGLVLALVGGYI